MTPAQAAEVLRAARSARRTGETLPAGSVVLAGALTDAVPLLPGHQYRLSIEGLGTILTAPNH